MLYVTILRSVYSSYSNVFEEAVMGLDFDRLCIYSHYDSTLPST